MMRTFAAAIAVTAFLAGGVDAAQAEEVRWLRSYDQAIETARKAQVPLLIYVTHPQCHFCRLMDRETFASPVISGRLNERFISVKVDASEEPELVKRLGVAGFPAMLIAGPNLKLLDRADGFVRPASFAERLDAVTGAQ